MELLRVNGPLAIFDFSGTLSLETVLFTKETRLLEEFRSTGLWELGVTSAARFWGEVIHPTWSEGGTTAKGYRRVLFERLRTLAQTWGIRAEETVVWESVSRFVERYLAASTIDPVWKDVLNAFARRPGARLLVATDHYTEATSHIVGQFKLLGMEAVPIHRQADPCQVKVANSADLGFFKQDVGFWLSVQRLLGGEGPSRVLFIDDFRWNEPSHDRAIYRPKAEARLRDTAGCLSQVFDVPVEVYPFFLEECADEAHIRPAYQSLVQSVGAFLERA